MDSDDEKIFNIDADPVNRNWLRIVARMKRGRATCPRCLSTEVVPIVYGFPDEATRKKEAAWKLILGGCVLDANSPQWHCKNCGQKFGETQEASRCEN